ncbi:MAG: glycosyltransferase family 4 protein [Candidatus Omnitrophica bacterium]|nr:glycosyltransferase family 4 protein [Candidatus Omnitrophota bacterium]
MKIGIAGPMSLKLLEYNFEKGANLPIGYDFPLISMLVNALLRRGHEVVAYTTSMGIEQPVVYEGKNLTICITKRRRRHAGRDLFRLERRGLVELMRKYPVDIIHAHWSYEFAWAALDTGIPTLVTLHDDALTILKHCFDSYRFLRLAINYIVLHRARYLSVVSQYLFNKLSRKNKKKARIIPNFYSELLEESSTKPVNKSSFILSVCNGFSRRKNVTAALKAFSIIRKKRPDIGYHLVGDGMESDGPAYEYAAKNRLEEGVSFIGSLSYIEIIEKIKKAMVLLHPSREEACSMVIIEAMALGTPVVGGRYSGGVPFQLEKDNAGVLCDIDSPEDTARGVLKTLSDSESAQSLISRAKKFAEENFAQEAVVQAYIDYYKEILNKS